MLALAPAPSWHDEAALRERAGVVATELSVREREVLALMASGVTNVRICEELWVSPRTVETHVRNIFHKLWLPPDGDLNRRVASVLAYLAAADDDQG